MVFVSGSKEKLQNTAMGKSNKPTKWFKAVKKAFRSPSKDRPPSQDDTKFDTDEKLLAKHDLSPVSHQSPTPHPLPSFEIITYDEVESEHIRGQALPTPVAVDPAISVHLPEEEEAEEDEEVNTSNNIVHSVEKHHDDDNDSFSEQEEPAIRIQQRFGGPLALKGLIRLQALVRGHQVRRQAATTLRTMEAIVRIQALVRGRRVRLSKDGQAVRTRLNPWRRLSSRPGQYVDEPWDPNTDNLQDNEPRTSWRGEDAHKRKRPTAYLLTQQLKKSTPHRSLLIIDCDPDQPHWGWTWLELWTNARPWEIRQLEDSKDFIEIIPSRKNCHYTTKEVDVNTLKVKYYEDYVSNPVQEKSCSASPSSEKRESEGILSDWQHESRFPAPVPVPLPVASLTASTIAHSHFSLSKPAPIEVPTHPAGEEDANTQLEPRTPEAHKSPGSEKSVSVPPSPVCSDESLPVPPSRQSSEASLPVPDTPPEIEPTEENSSVNMEHLVLPEAQRDTNGAMNSPGLSAPNGVHQSGEDVPSDEKSASDAVNGHTCNGHQENGETQSRKGEKSAENGDNPVPSKRTTCRYMAATESAKAKFRSTSNPKSRSPDNTESPIRTPKRHSIGGAAIANTDSLKPAFVTRRTSSFQNRWSPSPKIGVTKDKPRSMEAGAESPARRNSFGGTDGKLGARWRT